MSSTKSIQVLDQAVSELTYLPIPEQRKAKWAFWARFNENPICDPSEISLALALRLGGDNRVSKWWGQEGFKEWFQNRDEFRQRIEYLANLALDTYEQLLIDPKANASARVNAGKVILEVARKMPSRGQVEKYLDEKIAEMDRAQLEQYIQGKLKYLPLTVPQEADTTSNDDSGTDSQ